MRVRVAFAALALTVLNAAPALAHDNGEGLVGETDDRIITFFSLGVILFFTFVIIVGTVIQQRLEARKEARKAADLRRRVGW